MTFNVRLNPNPESRIVAKVTTNQGFINPKTLTVKNQFREYQINSIQDLPDVDEVNVVTGSTLVYNASSSKYEVQPLNTTFITGIIDGGEF